MQGNALARRRDEEGHRDESPGVKTRRVKRGNLHPEQHQIGKRGVEKFTLQAGSAELAGRWLEPGRESRPRGMAASAARGDLRREHRTRLTGRLPLLSVFASG